MREFEEAWNFSMVPKGGKTYDKTGAHDVPSTRWGRDIERLIKSLHVVDNWDQAMYERVAKSAGSWESGAVRRVSPGRSRPPPHRSDQRPDTSNSRRLYASPHQ